MTSHRLVHGSFVKLRKKPQLFGKIIEEEEQKAWSVKLESGDIVSKKSNQLVLIRNIEELPNDIRTFFGLEAIPTTTGDTAADVTAGSDSGSEEETPPLLVEEEEEEEEVVQDEDGDEDEDEDNNTRSSSTKKKGGGEANKLQDSLSTTPIVGKRNRRVIRKDDAATDDDDAGDEEKDEEEEDDRRSQQQQGRGRGRGRGSGGRGRGSGRGRGRGSGRGRTATATTVDTNPANTVPVHIPIPDDVLEGLNVNELKLQLKNRLQPTSGLKAVLQKRLKVTLENKEPYYTDTQLEAHNNKDKGGRQSGRCLETDQPFVTKEILDQYRRERRAASTPSIVEASSINSSSIDTDKENDDDDDDDDDWNEMADLDRGGDDDDDDDEEEEDLSVTGTTTDGHTANARTATTNTTTNSGRTVNARTTTTTTTITTNSGRSGRTINARTTTTNSGRTNSGRTVTAASTATTASNANDRTAAAASSASATADDNDDEDDAGPPIDIGYFDEILYEESKEDYYKAKMANAMKEKEKLIGTTIDITNGSGRNKIVSKWEIIENVEENDVDFVLDNNVGIPGVDFNQLEDAEYPLAELFNRMFPGNPIDQLKKLNAEYSLRYPKKSPVSLKEYFLFWACIFIAVPVGYGGRKLWYPTNVKGAIEQINVKNVLGMTYDRFHGIKGCIVAAFTPNQETKAPEGTTWCPIPEKKPTNDEWGPLQAIVNDFNENRRNHVHSSNQKIADESISGYKPRQTKTGTLPSLTNQPRKPVSMGIEFKNVACRVSGVMLHLEIVREKDEMHKAALFNELGSNGACTVRLATAACKPGDIFNGDAYFGQVKVAMYLKREHGIESVCIVKTGNSRHPIHFFDKTMKEWPAGTDLVLRSCFADGILVAIGHKYHSKNVANFISTYGTYPTTHGDPYKSKYRSASGNYATREINRPLICTAYYKAANIIDSHNQQRQGYWKLEEHWGTNDGFQRGIKTVMAMTAVDIHLITNHCFPAKSKYVGLCYSEFANALAYQLSQYPYPRQHDFGSYIPREGEIPLRWFERVIPNRYTPSVSPTGSDVSSLTPSSVDTDGNFSFSSSVVEPPTRIKVGNTTLEEGWSLASAVTIAEAPRGAPLLSCDITAIHRQGKIKKVTKAKRTRACRICSQNLRKGITQKKPPFLCIECGDFFCHDIESSKAGSEPRCCFWAHMCEKYKESGAATGSWVTSYDRWNELRVNRCIDDDAAS